MKNSELPRCPFEHIPDQENIQIDEITDLTVKLLDKRYTKSDKPILRGVHPKSHGCVQATFKINDDIVEELRVGLFANPGQEFQAILRFSNAAARVTPDIDKLGNHGSRGMAMKVLDVGGEVLLDDQGEHNQDFLMINQPMFAFANTDDYLQLNRILLQFNDDPRPFFARVPELLDKLETAPEELTETDKRLIASAQILKGIQNTQESEDANPLEMQYFSAAPFLFGDNKVMKFSVKPLNKAKTTEFPEAPDDHFLRQALAATMKQEQDILFSFLLQVRPCSDDDLGIEDATSEWKTSDCPFQQVALITIPSQQNDPFTPERLESCEKLEYNPWHSLTEHQPIGSINRLRKPVYQASAKHRRPKY